MNRVEENSFLLCVGPESDLVSVAAGPAQVERDGVRLYANVVNQSHFRVLDDGLDLAIYYGAELHRDPHYTDGMLGRQWDPGIDCGILVRFRGREQSVSIHSDFLGTELVYYGRVGASLLVSNRIENVARFVSRSADFAGIYQFLAGAFTVGSRTVLRGISQSRALSTVVFEAGSGVLRENFQDSWTKNGSADALKSRDFVVERWKSILGDLPDHVVMLSAGWDSRLLLTAPRVAFTYTHGDLASREVLLAFQLASERSLPMVFNPLSAADYSVERLGEMNRRLGHAFFPHWYFAAEYSAHLSAAPLTSGLFVEHLSGHYGINSLSSGANKLRYFAGSMLAPERLDGLGDDESIDLLAPLLSRGPGKRPWYMGADWRDYFADANKTFGSDVREVLAGYALHRTTGVQELCERFRLEHSGRQYFVNQTKCALPYGGYYHAYGDSRLSQAVIRIPYRDRISYKLSRWILQNTDPTLMEYPLAATLVKANRSIVLQEASRLARIGLQRLNAASVMSRGNKLGWNNFQFLFDRGVFESYVESLRSPIWSKESMYDFIKRYGGSGGSAYSLMDMFSKILTVDHRISI